MAEPAASTKQLEKREWRWQAISSAWVRSEPHLKYFEQCDVVGHHICGFKAAASCCICHYLHHLQLSTGRFSCPQPNACLLPGKAGSNTGQSIDGNGNKLASIAALLVAMNDLCPRVLFSATGL